MSHFTSFLFYDLLQHLLGNEGKLNCLSLFAGRHLGPEGYDCELLGGAVHSPHTHDLTFGACEVSARPPFLSLSLLQDGIDDGHTVTL